MSPLPTASSLLQAVFLQRNCIFACPLSDSVIQSGHSRESRLKRLTQAVAAEAGAGNGGYDTAAQPFLF